MPGIGKGVSPALKGSLLNPFALSKIASWLDAFDFVNNKWLDKSGNGNDFLLGNSYCAVGINKQGATLNAPIIIDITQAFSLTLEIMQIGTTKPSFVCGSASTSCVDFNSSGLKLITPSATLTFTNIFATQDVWNTFTIVGNGSQVTCTNVTNSVTQTINIGSGTTVTIARIGGRGNSAAGFTGAIRKFNYNDICEFRFCESPSAGLSVSYYYDIIGNYYLSGNSTLQQHLYDDKNHYNLQHGYSIWEDGIGGVRKVPYLLNGNPKSLTPGTNIGALFLKTYDCPASITRHNGCETAISAPVALLDYDVENYLFTGGIANALVFDTISDNRGNKIFANKSVINYYYDFIVFKEAQA